ncbi:hypothetical protein ABTQ33_09390 [Paucilactobacillus suebicus]|uniref:YxjI n=1 Tax=Paucilactobacillus suebicus DSM 5007 = KCTC 3549 TaxID=1423807 RepID=A0A0R1W7N2_9LACO|nr:hypothetical protein [Paucilactobacillus suebicus]KRM13570.1 hypothetical protein FD16_GL000139 [Paucilactobacillus suebicus DSM 5007 = KCTC 3549]
MRTLYIHQHTNDLRGATTVKDGDNNTIYLLVGKWGMRQDVLSLYETSGELLAEIKQLTLGLLPKFAIFQNNRQIGVIGKSLGFVREVIYIRGLNWIIVGNVISESYRVYHGTQLVFSFKSQVQDGQTYSILQVADEDLEPVCVVISAVLNHWARRSDKISMPKKAEMLFNNNLTTD